jgi:hypothetical protein
MDQNIGWVAEYLTAFGSPIWEPDELMHFDRAWLALQVHFAISEELAVG